MKKTIIALFAAFAAAAGFAEDPAVESVTERLALLPAVYNGTNFYRAAAVESHLADVRVFDKASTSAGTAVGFDVDGDKTLVIDRLRGGRGLGSTLTKTGAGTLRIGDGLAYGGTVVLEGGTLDMAKRPIPSESELPADPFLHLDASDASSLVTTTENGTNFVSSWASDGVGEVGGARVTGVQAFMSWKYPKFFRPWLAVDALGPGRPAVDFGVWDDSVKFYPGKSYEGETWPVACGAFEFVTNGSHEAASRVTPAGLHTYIAVVGAQRGGGTMLCTSSLASHDYRPFERGTARNASKFWKYPITKPYKVNAASTETIVPGVWQDGRRVNVNEKFDTPAFHVVAVTCDPKNFTFSYIGAYNYSDGQVIAGGMYLAELFVYDRELSETEVLDVQAYLSEKWMGVYNPGYLRKDGQPDLARVTVAAETAIDVPAGTTNRIGTLTLDAALVKSGGGTLEVFELKGSGKVVFAGGELRYADRPDSGDELAAVAPGASLHLDPCCTGTMTFSHSVGGTNAIGFMASVSGDTSVVSPYYRPWYVTEGTLNSLPMMFFDPHNKYGRSFYLGKPLDGVRSVYMIWDTRGWDTDGAGGYSIGSGNYTDYNACNVNKECWDFMRDNGKAGKTNARLIGNSSNDVALHGVEIFTNGVEVARANAYPAEDFQLVEFHLDNPAHVSGVKVAFDRLQTGGLGMMGDIIIYERELTEREKVRTRNYLMKKWFNAEPAPLPEKPASSAGLYLSQKISVDGEFTVELENAYSNVVLQGSGTFVKSGPATMQARSLLDFTGTVEVAEGTLVLDGVIASHEPKMATEGQTLRFDMSEGVIKKENTSSGCFLHTVTNLAPVAGDVVTIGRVGYPRMLEDELNGLPVLIMPGGYCMEFFDGNGNPAYLSDIHTLFWVVGSQEGGGFLMGGGTNAHTGTQYPFHRGVIWQEKDVPLYTGFEADGGHLAPYTNGNGQKEYFDAAFRLNFQPKTGAGGCLSGGYDVLSMVIPELDGVTYTKPLNAQGFAFDGRSGKIKTGCQRLGEVLAYNRRLTAEEVAETETYLAVKWGLLNMVPPGRTSAGIVVRPGAVLDLASTTQTVAFVSGGGTVAAGGIVTGSFKYDFAAPALLNADAFSFEEGFSIELANVPDGLENGFYPILAAETYLGDGNARAAVFTGDTACSGKRLTAKFSDGVYGIKVTDSGTTVIVR